MNARRIFVAVDISDEAREACELHIKELRHNFPSARVGWELPEKLHITLKFVGHVEEQSLQELLDRLTEIGLRYKSIMMRLSRAGVFPSPARPRILWIGTEDRSGTIGMIQGEIEHACREIGVEEERRRFTPHLTVGRIREAERSRELARAHLAAQIEPVEFEVHEIVLYESTLQPTGSSYSVISTARLGRLT